MQEADHVCEKWIGIDRVLSFNKHAPHLSFCEASDWNQRISASLFCDVSHVEIAMRNLVDRVLSERATRNQAQVHWLYQAGGDIARYGGVEADRRITQAITQARRHKRECSPQDVLAELTLGFWLNFFSKRYQPIHPDLVSALGGAVTRNLSGARPMLSKFREIRNRLAHHHGMLHRDLEADHRTVMLVAEFLDPDLARFVRSRSTFAYLIRAFTQTAQAES